MSELDLSLSEVETATSPAPPVDQPKSKSTKSFWVDIIETLVVAAIIFEIINNFIAQPHLVRGDSMMPNYQNNEYILTSKFYTWWGTPQRGDVIVLKSPDDKSVQFIKRIIGLPGEKIKIAHSQITIYNQAHPTGIILHEGYIKGSVMTAGRTFIPEGETVAIPANDYVVMGDNRDYSYDSRTWGFLNKQDIVGKVFFVYWPLNEFGLSAQAKY